MIREFARTLRKIAAEDKTLQWVGKIFFIHQVTIGVATRHEGNNEHQGLLYLDLAFHHCGLPHLISDGGHGVWYVSVAIEVRANNRHCVLWKTSAHASAIHELAGITLQSACRLVDVGNP
ncbi:hypothetical protein CC2G_015105 [Coprinopsis cinerea AmutBmut pab1-1]|nr:hypothetical protein CC2G_015105 [Coprinopsis cinerea AmutBmut pab1-1]